MYETGVPRPPHHTRLGADKFHGLELFWGFNRKVLLTTPSHQNVLDITQLTDDELWERTLRMTSAARAATCDLIEHLAEIDRRNLTKKRGHGSLFDYCVHTLGCSEAAAFRRIRAARAIRIFPHIKALLREGQLTLESVALIHPFLETSGAEALVQKARGKKVWQIQELIAGRRPDAPRRDVVRICAPIEAPHVAAPEETGPLLAFASAPHTSAPDLAPAQDVVPTPPAAPAPTRSARPPHSIRVAFTADAEFHKLMLRARALLRHKYPDGRLEGVLKEALVALLKRKDPGFRWQESVTRAKS